MARRRDVRRNARRGRRPVHHRSPARGRRERRRSPGTHVGAGSLDPEPPFIRRTGSFLYLRLRRPDYDAAALDAWAARIEPFLAAGDDVFVFFRHDPVGRAAELAAEMLARFSPD